MSRRAVIVGRTLLVLLGAVVLFNPVCLMVAMGAAPEFFPERLGDCVDVLLWSIRYDMAVLMAAAIFGIWMWKKERRSQAVREGR